MTDATTRSYVTGIIIFTMIILGSFTILNFAIDNNENILISEKDTELYNDYKDATDKQEQLLEKTENLGNSLKELEEPNVIDVLNILFLKGFNVLMSIFTSFGFFTSIITNLAGMFGLFIPSWVGALVVALITIMIVFSVVSAILQRNL